MALTKEQYKEFQKKMDELGVTKMIQEAKVYLSERILNADDLVAIELNSGVDRLTGDNVLVLRVAVQLSPEDHLEDFKKWHDENVANPWRERIEYASLISREVADAQAELDTQRFITQALNRALSKEE